MVADKLRNLFKDALKCYQQDNGSDFSNQMAVLLRQTNLCIGKEELMKFVLNNPNSNYQTFDPWSFGHPSITVFSHDNLCLDLNFWRDESITIHDHNFKGAFQILSGSIKNIEFNFKETSNKSDFIGFGELSITKQELLSQNEVRPIPDSTQNDGHLIRHTETPTINLVIREKWPTDNFLNIFFYPGMRFRHDKDFRNKLIKKLQILTYFEDPSTEIKSIDSTELMGMYIYRKFAENKNIVPHLQQEISQRPNGENFISHINRHQLFMQKILIS